MKKVCVILLFLLFGIGWSQNPNAEKLRVLDSLISQEQYESALKTVNQNIDELMAKQAFYDVTDFTYYLGKITAKLNNNNLAEQAVLNFAKRLQVQTDKPKALRQLHLEMGSFYEFLGDSKSAIAHNLKALEYTQNMPDTNGQLLGLIYSNLGVFESRTGNIPKATAYHKKAIEAYKSYDQTPKEQYYITYNSLGAMMWYASKIDSALYYYQEAEKTLNSLNQTPKNKYLRPASLNNNIAAIYSIQGNMDASIKAMEKTIQNLNTYLKLDDAEANKDAAKAFLFQAIDNYGGLFKDIGNYKKAKELIAYAFEQKQKTFAPDSPEIAKGYVLLGQIELALKEYQDAETHLNAGIEAFENIGHYPYWLGDAFYYQGMLLEEKQEVEAAKSAFQKSELLYDEALGDYYDETVLDFSSHVSHFYAQHGYVDKALDMANRAHDYIVKNQGEKTLLEYYQVLNLAEINYDIGNYKIALDKSKLALTLLQDSTFVLKNKLGNIQIESCKPEAMLLKVKSQYQLQDQKNTTFLDNQLTELQQAISILEQKKALVSHDDNVSILIADNNDIFEFAKTLALQLYQKTGQEHYLLKVLSLHESMLYNRIRNRLKSQSSLNLNLPTSVTEEETQLKNTLNASIQQHHNVQEFMDTQNKWNAFLETLKTDYPNYYNLKYASISQSLKDVSSKTPEHATIIRYAFIDDHLYAFVIFNSDIHLIDLQHDNLQQLIHQTHQPNNQYKAFSELYNILWKPLEGYIKTEKVTIVPDQILFNLSFETLTPKTASTPKSLVENCLLSTYIISYHYSLFLMDKPSKTVGYDKSFVAFAPEFNDDMKDHYKIAIRDSITVDKTYLKLLPQPFSVDLAKDFSKWFKGDSFLNENASKTIFLEQANEHKIIHIGTHAESNNISPELSRLIFAKDASDKDNSLYTYEIYNQNLNANLAILTACETGKPTYQAGEGMISLAHAFNYAGSESILTSLWEIDEQSSTEIVKHFYHHLANGLPKDQALQQAKLDYLATAKGRTISPDYWAGLVLIGNTAPIDISTRHPETWLILAFIAITTFGLLYFRNRFKT